MSAVPVIEAKLSIDLSKLEGITGRASDLTSVWLNEVQPYVTDFLMKRFDTEGAHMGQPWAPLSAATKALRKQPGRGRGGIGRDTNRLWASLVKSAGSTAAPGGLLVVTPTRYERGSALPHARFFAGGFNSTRKPVKGRNGKWVFIRRAAPKRVPARPIFPDPLPEPMVAFISGAVRRYVAGGAQ